MPLITDVKQVEEIFKEVEEARVCLPCFCLDDQRTMEAILKGTLAKSRETGIPDLPVMLSCTVKYPARGQALLYTTAGSCAIGLKAIIDDLRLFCSEGSPYGKLRTLFSFDHVIPGIDDDEVLYDYLECLSTIMYDASERPFDENIEMTARYVEKVRGKVLVEGAADEIYEKGSGRQKSELTTVERARRYLGETGVFLIVANLGTEHRAADYHVRYRGERAREISAAVGKRLVLHGATSVKREEFGTLASDGVIKVNIFTAIARAGGQAVARKVLEDMGNIFSEREMRSMIEEGWLGEKYLAPDYAGRYCDGAVKPKLKKFAEPERRDAWVKAVGEKVKEYLDILQYENFAR